MANNKASIHVGPMLSSSEFLFFSDAGLFSAPGANVVSASACAVGIVALGDGVGAGMTTAGAGFESVADGCVGASVFVFSGSGDVAASVVESIFSAAGSSLLSGFFASA